MKRISGIELIEDREGEGRPAQKGDRVVYNTRLFLNKGDEMPLNAKIWLREIVEERKVRPS